MIIFITLNAPASFKKIKRRKGTIHNATPDSIGNELSIMKEEEKVTWDRLDSTMSLQDRSSQSPCVDTIIILCYKKVTGWHIVINRTLVSLEICLKSVN